MLHIVVQVDPGREIEVVTMILECCSQEKTYIRWVLIRALNGAAL